LSHGLYQHARRRRRAQGHDRGRRRRRHLHREEGVRASVCETRVRRRYWALIAERPPRSTNFWTLPVAVFGSSFTKWYPVGHLKWASRERTYSLNVGASSE